MAKKVKPEYFMQFDGEVPAIGDGWRGVAVLKMGSKWVHLIVTGTQEKCRMEKHVWGCIPKRVMKGKKLTEEIIF